MHAGSERKQALINFAQREVEQYGAGVQQTISTNGELCDLFGYKDKTSVLGNLRQAGLVKVRGTIHSEIKRRDVDELITPSRDWAWMIAVLSMGGYVHPRGKIVLSNNADPELQEAFKSTGERLLGVNPTPGHISRRGLKYYRPEFSNVRAAQALGDLRREQWPNTIREKHSWIIGGSEYTWKFLEGIFDCHGRADTPRQGSGGGTIQINTIYPEPINFLSDLLTQVGLKNPYPIKSNLTSTGLIGLGMAYLQDMKLFAENIHSKVPDKEAELEFYRKKAPGRPPHESVTNEELTREWLRIKGVLGHKPSSREILRLRKQNITRFAPSIYAYRFGKTRDNKSGRSFILGSKNLEEINFPK